MNQYRILDSALFTILFWALLPLLIAAVMAAFVTYPIWKTFWFRYRWLRADGTYEKKLKGGVFETR